MLNQKVLSTGEVLILNYIWFSCDVTTFNFYLKTVLITFDVLEDDIQCASCYSPPPPLSEALRRLVHSLVQKLSY